MMIADEMAKQNLTTDNGGPFGAVVVKDGVVVGTGNNHVVRNNDPTARAEVMAIRNACTTLDTFDLSRCELYTSCYPCPMCFGAIIWANIRTVYYGNTKEDAAYIGFRDDKIYRCLNDVINRKKNDTVTLIPMDREETIKTFNDYLNKTDKTMY